MILMFSPFMEVFMASGILFLTSFVSLTLLEIFAVLVFKGLNKKGSERYEESLKKSYDSYQQRWKNNG